MNTIMRASIREIKWKIKEFRQLFLRLSRAYCAKVRSYGSGGQERLVAFWNLLMPGIPVGWPGPETRFDLETLLRTRGLDGLLFRLVGLDTFIHSLLPSMARYRQAVPEAPPRASYADFKAVMGKEALAPVSLGTRPWGVERAAAAANELVSSVDSGKIWTRIAFSASQVQNWREYRHSHESGNTN